MGAGAEVAPLANERVVITRAAHQASGLASAFETAGAEVALLPLIERVPPPDPGPLARVAREVADFDRMVLTSANAVEAFLPHIAGPARARLRVTTVGPATSRALRRFNVEPELEAERSRAEGLIEMLTPLLLDGERILIPRADDAAPDLAQGLRAAGAEVTTVIAYAKRQPEGVAATARGLFGDTPLGWVTMTSAGIARRFARLFGADWIRRRGELRALSIGPVTSAELRRLGVEPAAEAKRPSDKELVQSMIKVIS